MIGLIATVGLIISIVILGSVQAGTAGSSSVTIYIGCAAFVIVISAVSLVLNNYAVKKGADGSPCRALAAPVRQKYRDYLRIAVIGINTGPQHF